MNVNKLDDRTLATVLAALRFYQQEKKQNRLPEVINDIATNVGEWHSLSPRQIDDLCEELN